MRLRIETGEPTTHDCGASSVPIKVHGPRNDLEIRKFLISIGDSIGGVEDPAVVGGQDGRYSLCIKQGFDPGRICSTFMAKVNENIGARESVLAEPRKREDQLAVHSDTPGNIRD